MIDEQSGPKAKKLKGRRRYFDIPLKEEPCRQRKTALFGKEKSLSPATHGRETGSKEEEEEVGSEEFSNQFPSVLIGYKSSIANYVIERINGKNCKRENCNRREDLKKKNNVSTLSRFKRRSDATLRDEEDEWKNWKKRIIIIIIAGQKQKSLTTWFQHCSKRRRDDTMLRDQKDQW